MAEVSFFAASICSRTASRNFGWAAFSIASSVDWIWFLAVATSADVGWSAMNFWYASTRFCASFSLPALLNAVKSAGISS